MGQTALAGFFHLLTGLFVMPTFDVVSEVDKHELTNAIDQANRELATRFDFKGTDAKFELEGFVVTQVASSAFQLKQCWIFCAGACRRAGSMCAAWMWRTRLRIWAGRGRR